MSGKTKIFVDGNCIVCDMEISHYKRIAPELFDIVDISQSDFDAQEYGLTFEEVNKNMHVQTPQGDLRIGIDAFAHIWERVEKYGFLANLIKLPIINSIAKVGYKGFTVVRPFLPRKA